MNNHFSPKAPKPLLWPQTTFFGLPAASSVAAPLLRSASLFFCTHILRLPHPSQRLVDPVALEKPPPVRQTALFAPETPIQPPPVRQTALFAPETLIQPPPVRQTALFAPKTLRPSIPEPVDESILSTYKFVIKPDVIRIAILLTEVGEGIFTARSRVARFAVSLNE